MKREPESPSETIHRLRMKRDGYKARIAELSGALELALARLIKFEPPDSRAVSDEFVAMAVILAGGDIVNDESRKIVKAALAQVKDLDEADTYLPMFDLQVNDLGEQIEPHCALCGEPLSTTGMHYCELTRD